MSFGAVLEKENSLRVTGFVVTRDNLFKAHSMLHPHGDEIIWQSQLGVSSLGEGQASSRAGLRLLAALCRVKYGGPFLQIENNCMYVSYLAFNGRVKLRSVELKTRHFMKNIITHYHT